MTSRANLSDGIAALGRILRSNKVGEDDRQALLALHDLLSRHKDPISSITDAGLAMNKSHKSDRPADIKQWEDRAQDAALKAVELTGVILRPLPIEAVQDTDNGPDANAQQDGPSASEPPQDPPQLPIDLAVSIAIRAAWYYIGTGSDGAVLDGPVSMQNAIGSALSVYFIDDPEGSRARSFYRRLYDENRKSNPARAAFLAELERFGQGVRARGGKTTGKHKPSVDVEILEMIEKSIAEFEQLIEREIDKGVP